MKNTWRFLALFFLTGVPLCAEVDTGRPSNAPYDRYMGPVRQVFGRFGGASPSLDEVRSQLRTARRFRYYFNAAEPYTPQMPEVTEAQREGDCKAKSLWLASKMGDRSVRFVVGKTNPGAKMSHAWLFLDPTNESDVLYAERLVGRKLIPQYSYSSSSSYSHPTYGEYNK